jgi:multidrug efflux pump subunit AcrA (membrane-fusion protein)
MKLVYILIVALAAGLGAHWWTGQPASNSLAVAAASAAPVTALTATSEGTSLGEATVLTSHTYTLLAPTNSRIKRSYIELGQRVKKGAILLKFDNYNFLVAPASGIVTQQLVTYGQYVPHAAPVARFTELFPFRLRLPLATGTAQLKPGALLHVQDSQHPSQFLTGVVVANSPGNGTQLLDLRLHSLSSDPIAEGSKVRVNVLLMKQ